MEDKNKLYKKVMECRKAYRIANDLEYKLFHNIPTQVLETIPYENGLPIVEIITTYLHYGDIEEGSIKKNCKMIEKMIDDFGGE